jgi:hypothetical protein
MKNKCKGFVFKNQNKQKHVVLRLVFLLTGIYVNNRVEKINREGKRRGVFLHSRMLALYLFVPVPQPGLFFLFKRTITKSISIF